MRIDLKTCRCRGLTLLELVVVVAILAFMAGLVSYNLSPSQLSFTGPAGGKTAGKIATEVTLGRIKSAIYGSTENPGYWRDMNQDMWFFPRYLEWLWRPPSDAADVYGASPEAATYFYSMQAFNAVRKVGWRGPYLQFQGAPIPVDPARGYTARLGGGVGFRSPIDAWGNPVVMQWPSDYYGAGVPDFGDARGNAAMAVYIMENSRLVSPGPDGVLQTELNIAHLQTYADFQMNPALVGDDIVIWLQH
jgi:prepilin-type N-terminal cleavage/methylation domain-containing protein